MSSAVVPAPANADVAGEVGSSPAPETNSDTQPLLVTDKMPSKSERKKAFSAMIKDKLKEYGRKLGEEVEVMTESDVADRNVKALFSIGIAVFFTWFIIWAFLSWSRFSSVYASTSAQQRAKAAFLFILTILSVFILIFSASMMAFRKERGIYITLFFISAGLLSLMFALVGSDALTA
jgi:hypothetical protein